MGHKQKEEQKKQWRNNVDETIKIIVLKPFLCFWMVTYFWVLHNCYIALSVTALLHGIALKAYWYGMQISGCFYSDPLFFELLCIIIINIILQTCDLTLWWV